MISKLLQKSSPEGRVRAAEVLFWVSVVGWPASQMTVAHGEPPFILALSWFAIIFTAIDIMITTDVHRKQDEDNGEA